MTALTSGEKTLLRAGGHRATLYLSVLKPQAIFTARVAGAHDRGARSVAYNNDSGETSVLAGMTLWVGTNTGACDVGKTRVRAINTGTNTLTLAENSLAWASGQYLTVRRVWELWPVFPRFTAQGVFYKDYDIAYAGQNEQPLPVATMGPPRAGFDDGEKMTFTFANTGAGYAFGNETITTRNWDVVGPGTYGWTASGPDQILNISGANRFTDAHWVELTVTDSNGKEQTTRRPVFCHERTGANAPITAFALESLTGDWERGGWSARLRVFAGATAADFPNGTLVLIWHEATYGATSSPIGGNYTHARNVLFAGYVRGETVAQDWNTGEVTFEATTIDGLLRRSMMFSVPLKMILDTQDQWYEFTGPTVAEALHHYWRWHSTLFDIADVYLPTANTLRVETIEDFARGDLYSQADSFARHYGIFAHACCNKLGQLYVAEDAQMLNDARRAALAVVSDITNADRRGELTVVCQPEPRAGMVHLSGFAYTRTPLISKAPGDAPEDIGAQVIQVERQILENQSQANTLAGRVLAAANNPYPEVRAQFAGHYLGALDVVPQEWWTLSLAAGDTPRGIVWTDKRLVARQVTAHYDPASGSILADAVFEPEVDATDGVDGDYPTEPPGEDDVDPPLPPVTPPEPPAASGRLMAFDHNLGCLNQTAERGWEERNEGAETIADNQGGYDPHWQATQGSSDIEDAILWRVQAGRIYRTLDCGRNWAEVTGMGDPPNSWSDSPAPTFAACEVVVRTDNVYASGEHYFLVRWQNGAGDWRTWVLKCTGNGATWMWGVPIQFSNSLCRTAQSSPYNVLEVGDSVAAGTDSADNGYQIRHPTQRKFWFTPVSTVTQVTLSGEFYHAQNNWAVLDFHCRRVSDDAVMFDFAVPNSNGDWKSFSSGGNCTLTAGVQYYLLAYPLGGNSPWVRKIDLVGDTAQRPLDGYGIWMDTDTADGAYLYLTIWENDVLYLKKIATADLSIVSTVGLGAATIGEVLANTYIARPRVKEFDPGVVYVYGRMNAPAGLAGVQHIIKSTDAGGSFASVESGWGSDHCGVFLAADPDDVLNAIRNTGAAPVYYRGVTLEQVGTLPLAASVPPDAFTGIPGRIAAGAGSTVVETLDNGANWADQGYPAGGDIRSLVYVY